MRAADAIEPLADIAEAGDFFLAFPAIDALARISDSRVAVRLIPMLSRDDIREPVIDALAELAGAEAVQPLVDVLNHTGAAPAIARALTRLRERYEARYGGGTLVTAEFQAALQPSGAQRVIDAVAQAPADALRPLVTVLGWLRGRAVEQALTRLLGQPAVRNDVIEAIVREDAGVVELLVEQLRADDEDTRLAAVVALGRLGHRRAVAPLAALLSGGERAIVVATAAALARIGDLQAFEPLLPLLADPDATVRQAAIGALNSLGHPDMCVRVKTLLDSTDPLTRESAVRIAGYFGYRECVDAVLARCDDPVEGVRRAAVEHLPFLDDGRALDVLLRASRDGTPKVRAAAAQGLARMDEAAAGAALLDATRDADGWVRYYAARALGERRAAEALPRLAELAREPGAMHVRIAALEAVAAIDGADAADILLPYVDGDSARPRGRGVARSRPRVWASCRRRSVARDPAIRRSPGGGPPPSKAGRGTGGRKTGGRRPGAGQPDADTVAALQWTAGADEDDRVANAAVDALGALARRADAAGDGAAAALTALTAEPRRRDAAIAALAGVPEARIDRVAAGLSDPRPAVRGAIIAALGRLKHPDASAAIRTALADADPAVREAAITALDRLGARGTSRRFAEMARDDESRAVRRAAAAALSRHGAADPDGPRE